MSVPPPTVLRFDNGHARAESARQPDGLALHLIGDANMLAVEPIRALLEEVHREALEVAAKEVVVNMRELQFLNSSCFKAFVAWIHDVGALEVARRYRIRLLASQRIYWQSRSLHALRMLAPELVTIEEL